MNPRSVRVWLSCSFLLLASAAIADEPAAKAPEVPVVRPVAREVTDYEEFTGRIEAASRVELRPRVTGYLQKAAFREGDEVKVGDLLFEIDPRPYKAALDRAQASLRQAEARVKVTEANMQRLKAMATRGGVAPEEVDKAAAEQAEAAAALQSAKASLEAARLNLDFTRVSAPIAGRIGQRLLDPGNLVMADNTLLATIVSRDPMYVYFEVDERAFLRLRRAALNEKGKVDKMPVAVGLADEEGYPRRGVVDFVDNQVHAQAGTIRMRAVLPNKDDLLRPGLFVRVRLPLGAPYQALLIPAEAVLAEDGIKVVYVVNDKGVIEARTVELGRTQDGLRIVRRGLKAEDRVVVGRLQRLRPGKSVQPMEDEKPAPPRDKPGADARPARGEPGPVIVVEAEYPGANAAVIADTVAAPIEEQVRGIEKVLSIRSRCTNDGKYRLAVTFARGADPKFSHVLVQNRVNIAEPVLPEAVKKTGVTTRQRMPGVWMFVTLHSPGGRYDEIYLSNYARIQIKDELTRLPGVADVTLVGVRDYSLRIWLDTDKLAARNLTAAEVVRALEQQNVQATTDRPAKDKEQDAAITVNPLGRLIDVETLADVVLKTDGEKRVVRLKDVANIELGAGGGAHLASLDGKPAVALAVHTLWDVSPRKLSAAVRKVVAELRSRLPDGLDLSTPFDFTANIEAPNRPETPEYLLLDPDLPVGASAERIQTTLRRCEALLRQVPGVQHTLLLSDDPFDLFGSGPCVLVALTPAKTKEPRHGEIAQAIRTRLDEIKQMSVRVRDLSGPGSLPRGGYLIDLAVCGPDAARVRDFATKLADRLQDSKKLTDVSVSAASRPRLTRTLEIDRDAAKARGVSMTDISNTLQVYFGSLYINDFTRFGRTWRIDIQAEPGKGDEARDLKTLKIRNTRGQMIPLSAIARLRETDEPLALDFLDSRPMVQITANPAADAALAEVRTVCERLAEAVRKELRLSAEYRLSWLRDMPGKK
jgi:RND family efflux transporter MFP subunit